MPNSSWCVNCTAPNLQALVDVFCKHASYTVCAYKLSNNEAAVFIDADALPSDDVLSSAGVVVRALNQLISSFTRCMALDAVTRLTATDDYILIRKGAPQNFSAAGMKRLREEDGEGFGCAYWKNKCKGMDEQISQLRKECDRKLFEQKQKQEEELERKDKELKRKEKELEKKDEKLEKRDEEIEEKDEEIERNERALWRGLLKLDSSLISFHHILLRDSWKPRERIKKLEEKIKSLETKINDEKKDRDMWKERFAARNRDATGYFYRLMENDAELRKIKDNYREIIVRHMEANRSLQEFDDIFVQGLRGY